MTTPTELTLTRPDDWHLHLRDGAALQAVLPYTSRQFARAIVMPNLKPPVRTVDEAAAYRQRILAGVPAQDRFTPLMTLYLTDNTSPDEVVKAKASGFVHAVKYYPAGATTNSDSGVTDIRKCDAVFEVMQQQALPLLLHGEVTGDDVDVFDRERVFVEKHLVPLVQRFPKLRIVVEHATTRASVEFVKSAHEDVGCTITPQHLLHNRNAIFRGGVRPHYYCLPILKREDDRRALLEAATSGSPKFFLGTDSAPHTKNSKESCCGAAGCFSALHALELYATAFESVDKLNQLEGFASFFGADYYRLPRNQDQVTLRRESWTIPDELPFTESGLVPLHAGENLAWRMV